MRCERQRNLSNQQLQSFLACFPETIVNLHSRMETIFQKGKRILIVRGKCWVACIISTSLRGGLASLPSSAPTSPSTQIFGIMHGQHNLRSCMMISKSHLFSRTRVNFPPTSDPDARQPFLQLPKSD